MRASCAPRRLRIKTTTTRTSFATEYVDPLRFGFRLPHLNLTTQCRHGDVAVDRVDVYLRHLLRMNRTQPIRKGRLFRTRRAEYRCN